MLDEVPVVWTRATERTIDDGEGVTIGAGHNQPRGATNAKTQRAVRLGDMACVTDFEPECWCTGTGDLCAAAVLLCGDHRHGHQ